jgi:hypothetical protein
VLNAYSIILRLPTRHSAKKMQDWYLQPLPFALLDKTDHVLHSGSESLIALAEHLKKVKKVYLIVAASDVTLLRLMAPPLSPEKLKLALPAFLPKPVKITNKAPMANMDFTKVPDWASPKPPPVTFSMSFNNI